MIRFALMLVIALTTPPQISVDQDEDPRKISGLNYQDIGAMEELDTFDPSNEQFKKLLYRTGTVDPLVLRQFASLTKKITFPAVIDAPEEHYFYPFELETTVLSVHRFDFDREDARDFLSGFYIALCKSKDGNRFYLLTRSTVSTWPLNETLPNPQPIRFKGFFFAKLKPGRGFQPNGNETGALPIFVAKRFEWHPYQANEALGVDDSMVALSNAGVDISLLDFVKARNGKSIGARESTCYWQMLAACKALEPNPADKRIDFASMLTKPLENVGKRATITGRVRQCVPVKVTAPEAVELLGTDTWYQLSVFPDLDGRPIRVPTRDGDPEVYRNAFPVTVCILDLPESYDQDSIIGNTFVCDGFFYRIWAYPSERTDKSKLDNQQSPLIMASVMTKVESTGGQLQMLLVAILFSIAIAIAAIGWFVFRTKKSAPLTELPEKIEAW